MDEQDRATTHQEFSESRQENVESTTQDDKFYSERKEFESMIPD